MKILVDSSTNEIRGLYQEPFSFSLSGRYVIDIPSGISVIISSTNSSDAITKKRNAIESAHPDLTYSEFDEFINVSRVDTVLSNAIFTGPNKRTVIQPGGRLVTTSIVPAVVATKTFIHYDGYSLYRDIGIGASPVAARMLMNYDPILGQVPFITSMITATVTDSAGVDQYTPTPDIEELNSLPSPFRLAFTNNTDVPMHIGDWAFLYV